MELHLLQTQITMTTTEQIDGVPTEILWETTDLKFEMGWVASKGWDKNGNQYECSMHEGHAETCDVELTVTAEESQTILDRITPGEWLKQGVSDNEYEVHAGEAYVADIHSSFDGEGCKNFPSKEQCKANATLIQQAPKMAKLIHYIDSMATDNKEIVESIIGKTVVDEVQKIWAELNKEF